MAPISTDSIKELREKTGISVMQCKKALEEAGGDMEKALIILSKQSAKAAAKKSGRSLGAGTIASYIHAGGTVGAMVELSCETDFVARNEEFSSLAYEFAMHVAATNPEFLTRDDVQDEDTKKALEVFAEEAKDKPENMRDKIIEGKLENFLKEKVLSTQPFIKDPKKTVQDLVDGAVQKFGERVEIARFARFSVK